MFIEKRRCSCGKTYDLLFDERFENKPEGPWSALDHPDMDHLTCPVCGGAEYQKLVSTGTGIDLGGEAGVGKEYPRWDHGLGCIVNSATHRKWLLKHNPDGTPRDIPLRPIESSTDDPVGDFYEKKWDAAEAAQKKAREDQERFNYENREHLPRIERFVEELNREVAQGRMPDLRRMR